MSETRAAVLLSFLAFAACKAEAPAAQAVVETSPLAAAVSSFVESAVAEERVAGAVALVARGDEIVALEAAGMADREAGREMTEDTLFRIASMSKPITSVGVMMLVEEGKLALEDPVAQYVPQFADVRVLAGDGSRNTRASETAPTIRHLLTHTSGITYRFLGVEPLASIYEKAGISDGLVQTEGTIGESVTKLASLPLLHEPGARWSYGLSTDVLGYVIEVVSGQQLNVFLEERIFDPLEMDDTGFFVEEEDVARLAAVYVPLSEGVLDRIGEGPIHRRHLVFSTSYHYQGPDTYFSGGAGLVSTIGDYYRFVRMLANGGELDGVRLLEEETVREMTSNQIGALQLEPGEKFGFGFSVRTSPSGAGPAGTFGWGGFFHTTFWVDPENDLTGIFMSQLRPPEDVSVTDDFRKAVYEALR